MFDKNGKPIYKKADADYYLFNFKEIGELEKWYIGSNVNKSSGWLYINSEGKKLIFLMNL